MKKCLAGMDRNELFSGMMGFMRAVWMSPLRWVSDSVTPLNL